ncbi:anthranilate synthase component I family protein [Caldicellulosiruptoraceae bacterium PP1]
MNIYATKSSECSSELSFYHDLFKEIPVFNICHSSFDAQNLEQFIPTHFDVPYYFMESRDLKVLSFEVVQRINIYKNKISFKGIVDYLLENIEVEDSLNKIISNLTTEKNAFVASIINYSAINITENIFETDEEYGTLILYKYNIIYNKKEKKTYLLTVNDMNHPLNENGVSKNISNAVGHFIYRTPKDEYIKNVMKVKEDIRNGEIFQLVLSQIMYVESNITPFQLFFNLYENNLSDYCFLINDLDKKIVCFSPETLVKVEDEKILTYPIAGTYKLNPDENLNEKKYKLITDTKELSEHMMLVDLSRNDLSKVCIPGTVFVNEFLRIKELKNLIHIYSVVSGQLKNKMPFSSLLSVFPAGTLTGAPKVRAMQLINAYEAISRGLYGGAIGYFFNNTIDFAIAIRMAINEDEKVYRVQSGAGIVHLSKPENEYKECLTKAKSILNALGVNEDDINN